MDAILQRLSEPMKLSKKVQEDKRYQIVNVQINISANEKLVKERITGTIHLYSKET